MKLQTFAYPRSISYIHTLLHPSLHQMNADASGKRRRNAQRRHDAVPSIQSEGTHENELKGILTLLLLPDDHEKEHDDDLDQVSSTEDDQKLSLKENAQKSITASNSFDHDELKITERIRKRKKSRREDSSELELKSGASANNGPPHHHQQMDPELKVELVDDEIIVPEVALRSVNSMKARDLIAHNLLHHGFAGTSFL
ncbi:hypothetical protein K1719_010707 [Acacia pycnantha]|nr:hypothetical protein K1719_010707 [Acacia pycnantha]